MASSHPQNDDQQNEQTEDLTVENINNMLTFGRANAHAQLENLYDDLNTLCKTASQTLKRYVSLHSVYISSVERKHIKKFLNEARMHCCYAQGELGEPLKMAEENSRKALENFTHDDLQNMINAGQEHILWRRVALRRANVSWHVQQQFIMLPPAQILVNQAATSAFYLELSRDAWQVAKNRLMTRMNYTMSYLMECAELLAVINYRTGNVIDSSVREVHRVHSAVQNMVENITNTILVSFQQAINTLETLRKSAEDDE